MLLRAPSRRIVGSSRAMTASATMPIGRLTKKIQCQLTLSVRKPPRNGPTRKAMPKTAPKRPWYLPRSAGVNRSPMTASEIGNRAPAPRPWMPRKRISCHIVLAQAGQGRADQEDADADHQQRLAAVEVGQLAVDGDRHGAGQQVGRDDPGVEIRALEVGHDVRQDRARRSSGRAPQEQAQHDGEEDLEFRAVIEADRGIVSRIGLERDGLSGHGFHQVGDLPLSGQAGWGW